MSQNQQTMNENESNAQAKPGPKRRWPMVLVGFVLGVAATGVAVWQLMPGMMIVQHESRFGLDETVARLEQAIEANGWEISGVRNINKSMAKQGVTFDRQVRIVELCRAPYAQSVLTTNPEVSTLMPCAIGVWEGEDGKVHLAGMNMGLMGKMFGGNIAEIMGGKVAVEEKKILAEVVKE